MSSSTPTREFTEDDIGKDMQIKILKEKNDFLNKQLEEKDRQLDHYKQLCKTLKDLVSDLSSRQRNNSHVNTTTSSLSGNQSQSINSAPFTPITSTATAPPNLSNKEVKLRPPPGFGQPSDKSKQNSNNINNSNSSSIKGRKAKSFHSFSKSLDEDMLDEEEINAYRKPELSASGHQQERRSDDLQWRKPQHSSSQQLPGLTLSSSATIGDEATLGLLGDHNSNMSPFSLSAIQNLTTPTKNSNSSYSNPTTPLSNPQSPSQSRLKKSVSQSSLASWINNTNVPITSVESETSEAHRASHEKDYNSTIHDETSPRNVGFQSMQQPLRSQSVAVGGFGSSSSAQTVDAKKLAKLKKSQSMNSVYTVLEENRLDLKFPELDQLVGQIYPLSKYQQGCRFLQKKLDEKNATNTNIILTELFDHLVELLTDPFGNYLFSKLMEHCDETQRDNVVHKILPDILNIAFDMYGTQSLQKMMPFLTETQIEAVINTLKTSSIALIKHNKANYLIQYCLDNLSPKHNQWIYDSVCACMEEIARDRVGCVIVKRCIDHASPEQKEKLCEEIAKRSLALVQDPFGNYVVQHILDKYPRDPSSDKMIKNLLGSINELCVQKFSSNVIEKSLHVSNVDVREALLAEVIDSDMLPQLLNDRFANFVIQTSLDVANPDQRQQLVKNILPHLGRHYSPYTKRLQKKILQVQ